MKLTSYDIENVVLHLFNKREPVYDNWTLTKYFNNIEYRHIVLNYFIKRVQYCDKIIEKMAIVTMGSEQTRLFGCDFESTIDRGSQFRIETVLMRNTRKMNYLLMSATKI